MCLPMPPSWPEVTIFVSLNMYKAFFIDDLDSLHL